MAPRVSILLPNRNHRPFLAERLQTIERQTFKDWELIVLDGQSDDGSWEYLQRELGGRPNVQLRQAPPAGIYASWNQCLALARGEYVYIATADDTMQPTLLSAMVKALDESPDCDLAHCKLSLIDEQGQPARGVTPWDRYYGTLYFGGHIDRPHRRKPPHDGVLYSCVRTVYTSVTQLLIRRSLFQRIGTFRTDLGSHADFEWGMRAGLTAATVHVPEVLASWRVHAAQQTVLDELDSAAFLRKLLRMIRLAWRSARRLNPEAGAIPLGALTRQYRQELLAKQLNKHPESRLRRSLVLLRWGLTQPSVAAAYFQHQRDGTPFSGGMTPLTAAQELIARLGLAGRVETIPETAGEEPSPATGPDKFVSYNSPTHNDRWVVELFGGKRGGYFIEAGAADGVHGSCTFLLEKELGWRGLLVEPGVKFPALCNNRPASFCEQVCLGDTEDAVLFVDAEIAGFSGARDNLEREEKEHLRLWGSPKSEWRRGDYAERVVRQIPLHHLLDEHGAPSVIDYAAFDMEGAEMKTLKAFPFERYTIVAFSIEGFNCTEFLLDKGYVRVQNPFNTQAPWEHYFVLRSYLSSLSATPW